MELLITVAVIIGLWEIREWRRSKELAISFKSTNSEIEFLDSNIKDIDYQINCIHNELKELKTSLKDQKEVFNNHEILLKSLADTLDSIQKLSSETESKTATILREYELNGIPLGYQRKFANVDYVEAS